MKLWCPLLIFLLCTSSISSWYLTDYHDALINYPNLADIPSEDLVPEEDPSRRPSIVKRSQRNANILYRYCRRNGQARNFCLKYAIRMILATGH